MNEGTSYHKAALHPTGEAESDIVAFIREPHIFKDPLSARDSHRALYAIVSRLINENIKRLHPWVKVNFLSTEPNHRSRTFWLVLYINAKDMHRTAGFCDEPGDDTDDSSLAGTVGAEKCEELTRRHRE